MRRLSLLALFFAAILFGASRLIAQENPGGPPPQEGGGQNADGPGDHSHGPGGGFHLLPRFVEEKLNLTDDQKQQVAALEKETKAKLEKILTAEQIKTLETAHPPRPPQDQGGQGGQGGGPGPGPDGGGPGGN